MADAPAWPIAVGPAGPIGPPGSPGIVVPAMDVNQGLLWNGASFVASPMHRPGGTMDDANLGTNTNLAFRRDYTSANGINPVGRGDTIAGAAGDVGNGAGASFFQAWFLSMIHNTKGSMQGDTILGTIAAGAGGYAELGLREGVLTIQRDGAYGATDESYVKATNISRAVGKRVFMEVNHTLAAYAALLGAGSQFALTGPRTFSSESSGSQPAGSAYAVIGDHEFGLLTRFANQAKLIFASFQAGNAYPFASMTGLGVLGFGGGAAPVDARLQRIAAGLIGTPDNWWVTGTSQLIGAVTAYAGVEVQGQLLLSSAAAPLRISNAANFATTVGAAGAAAAMPQPVEYVTIQNAAGSARKIALFNP